MRVVLTSHFLFFLFRFSGGVGRSLENILSSYLICDVLCEKMLILLFSQLLAILLFLVGYIGEGRRKQIQKREKKNLEPAKDGEVDKIKTTQVLLTSLWN